MFKVNDSVVFGGIKYKITEIQDCPSRVSSCANLGCPGYITIRGDQGRLTCWCFGHYAREFLLSPYVSEQFKAHKERLCLDLARK